MVGKEPVARWNFDSLEKYLSERVRALEAQVRVQDERNVERFAAAKEAVTAALAAADKALNKAELSSEKRFEGLNELRSMAEDQTKVYLPRGEYTSQHQALVDKVDTNERRISAIETAQLTKKETAASSVGMIVAIVSVIYGVMATIGVVVTLLLRHGI